jgi:hypothetical protein
LLVVSLGVLDHLFGFAGHGCGSVCGGGVWVMKESLEEG